MNENLNLIEILKDCPKGTKLYSPIVGEVEFNGIDINSRHPIGIKCRCGVDNFTKDGRLFWDCDGECMLFPSKDERDWSKFKPKKHKFDAKTLETFDKVLVRDSNLMTWECECFSYIKQDEENYPYVCMYHSHKYCIPCNEDTFHLVGTTDEAPEFYRYWEH